jgi:hypothetical protein
VGLISLFSHFEGDEDPSCVLMSPSTQGASCTASLHPDAASGGYPWTVIRVQDRDAYMKALESASVNTNIKPFATFIAERVRWSMEQSKDRKPLDKSNPEPRSKKQ